METEIKKHRHYSNTFVPAVIERKQPIVTTIQPLDHNALLPQAAQTGHARQDDDAITHAKATLLVSSAYFIAAAMITVGLLLIVYIFRGLGSDLAAYGYVGMVIWGICVLVALYGNRKQGLWHSPSGISHHELDSRERIARHAIDTHAGLLMRRWEIDDSHE